MGRLAVSAGEAPVLRLALRGRPRAGCPRGREAGPCAALGAFVVPSRGRGAHGRTRPTSEGARAARGEAPREGVFKRRDALERLERRRCGGTD